MKIVENNIKIATALAIVHTISFREKENNNIRDG